MFYQKGLLCDFLEQRKLELKKEVESYDSNYILNVSEEDFIRYLVSKYSLTSPKIYEDKIYSCPTKEVDIDVSQDPTRIISDKSHPFYVKGIQITIALPFEGDEEVFQYRPSTFSLNPPQGEIVGQEIHLIYEMVEHDAEKLNQMYQTELDKIKKYLEWAKDDVNNFNKDLESIVRRIVSQRKKKLLDDLNLVSALGIPIKHRENIPDTYTIPSVRKKLKIEPPKVSKEPFRPEPILVSEEYVNILEAIYSMNLVMERNPKTFSKLKEEEIRNHFLIILNAIYEGQATGETFNNSGKTDILIRVDDKNIFVAECKFWGGEKKLLDTIDQLLGYTSWRDTKTSILLFNRTKGFSSVLKKIGPTVTLHSCYEREWRLESIKLSNETTFSYVFHQPKDINREIILTIMAFNVPK